MLMVQNDRDFFMRIASFVVLFCFALIFAAPPAAAQTMQTGPVPEWVEEIDLPRLAPEYYPHIRDGEAFHLVDWQVRAGADHSDFYMRIASEAANRAALETIATLVRDFDPNIETLTLVQLDAIRDGVRTELRDDLPIDHFRREESLEAGIIDGTISAFVQIPGIAVGDIVDTAVIWSSDAYVPGTAADIRLALGYSVPVGLSRIVIHEPAGLGLRLGGDWDGAVMTETAQPDGGTRYEWRLNAHVPRVIDDGTPPEYDPFQTILTTTFSDWGALGDTIAPHYTPAYPLPASWAARTDDILAEFDSDEARAFAALRMVQDEIRYVGLEVGAGGYYARSPETVVANHFGDCKDKSLLLHTMLQRMGIKSTVALANLGRGYGVADRLPALSAFNHMITGVWLDGGWYWMDPTGSFEAGFLNSAAEPNYGYVLPITGAGDGLHKIEPRDAAWGHFDLTETLTFTPLGMFLVAETVMTGARADRYRQVWANSSPEDLSRNYNEYYAETYPGIVATLPLAMKDDPVENRITLTESYILPRMMLMDPDLQADFPFYASHPFDRLPQVQIGARKDPLHVPGPLTHSHTILVRNAPIEFRAPDPVHMTNTAFTHDFAATASDGGNLDLKWVTQIHNRRVSAGEAGPVIAAARKAAGEQGYTWNLLPDAE